MCQKSSNSTLDSIKLPNEWKELLGDFLQSSSFASIMVEYLRAYKSGKILYPPAKLLFKAFYLTLPQNVRVVILGQDPYHGALRVVDSNGVESLIPQAMGLSFSVPRPLPPPPSLKNIYKELARTTSFVPPNHGDLSAWGERGVLLLNAILSVEANKPASHKDFGWENFSDCVISALSSHFKGIVFMLWGAYAKKKAHLIDSKKHCILTTPHPSPLAQGFVGSGVFEKAQAYFIAHGQSPIDWSL
ncbi:uracil-DNA glycosylase [Helicobacter himalayensis]|uniref:uracil-DNA glycosylase n=1 Tax=Helicobacter himalayensis TaxID=1591088 RepID=UPI000832B1E1|nr:uracil-DNA glycosylase [Helicobacter himalayensis]